MRLLAAAAALGLFFAASGTAVAQQGSVLLWPVNPVIEADARAAALWLENPGKTPITLQIRIFAWAQADGKSTYAPQQAVIGSPPLVTIDPGAKQLVRLTRLVPPPPAGETAYRIIVDEIPTGTAPASPGAGVNFRMRYSIPLFILGPDIGSAARSPKALRPMPQLRWRVDHDETGAFLEIRNNGPVHARLVDAAFVDADGKRADIAPGLLGYVLAASAARWPLPASLTPVGDLVVGVNGSQADAITPAGR
ncbi:MAG TPA: molecular chaperone [Sphingopyxis sp.]|nr:molecular chaperone [Sphingopyxis sp.]HMP43860.1 molecular chaperone [Sphingopyxis sp.]